MRSIRKKLPAVLDGPASEALLQKLSAARGKPVVIDASAVDRITVPALQILISAAKTWTAADVAFRIAKPSPAFLNVLSVLAVPGDELNIEGANL